MPIEPPAALPSFAQAHESECGTTCLALVLAFHGFPDLRGRLDELAFRELDLNLHRGADLLALSALAERLGFEASGYRGDLALFDELALPCIAHLRSGRFVVVWSVTARRVVIVDPRTGERTSVSTRQFIADWSGTVLELVPTDAMPAAIQACGAPTPEPRIDRLVRTHGARLVAKGGFASIYRGRRGGAAVAIKAVPAYFRDTDNAVRAFRRERRVLELCAPLEHPHIVRLIDVDEASRALVLEWTDGGTLDAVRAPLPTALAVRYIRQIAGALAALHQRGITHRDVTIGNVLLFPGEIAKLSDFGIARVAGEAGPDDVAPVYVSHAFASPEQLRHAPESSRSDVFSLALTLYWTLTGTHLFAPELQSIELDWRDPGFTGVLEARLRAVLGDDAGSIVRARLQTSRVAPGDALAHLLGRCLSHDPAARCDAAELEQSLAICGTPTSPAR